MLRSLLLIVTCATATAAYEELPSIEADYTGECCTGGSYGSDCQQSVLDANSATFQDCTESCGAREDCIAIEWGIGSSRKVVAH